MANDDSRPVVQVVHSEAEGSEGAPLTGPGNNLFSPYAGKAVAAFLTDDEGKPLLDVNANDLITRHLSNSSPSSIHHSWISSRLFNGSSTTVDSVTLHFDANTRMKALPLAMFCDFIAQSASLERARIMSVECWKERSRLGVLHRTLIIHLQRDGRADVWLRIDRDRSRGTSLPVFTLRGGRSEANDLAHIAGAKTDLLKRRTSSLENRMEFVSPPNLGVFRFCLQVICEELIEYRIWPEHLLETGKGTFTIGKLPHLQLAPQLRARVSRRVQHVVSPLPSISAVLASFSSVYRPVRFDGRLIVSEYLLAPNSSTSLMELEKFADNARAVYREVSARILSPALQSAATDLALCALSLERRIYRQQPSTSALRLLDAYVSYELGPVHSALDRTVFSELRELRLQYQQHPAQRWYGLACHLAKTARIASRIDPMLACACATEARTMVGRHFSGKQLWTDGQKLLGHRDGIISIAVSPDGKQIVSGSTDSTLIRWDALTGSQIGGPLTGHTAFVRAVAYSPDSRLIVSSSQDRTIRLWGALSGEPIREPLRGHTDWIRQIVFSSDGKQIVSASDDLTIRRWDVATGEAVGPPMVGHADFVWTVVCSPDGGRIVSGSKDNTVRIWDVLGGQSIGTPLKGHTNAVTSVVFSPDGRMIVSGSWDYTLRRWDAVTGESIGSPMKGHTNTINCVAFSPDGMRIASGSSDHDIRLWDALTGDSIGDPLVGHTNFLESVAFTTDGKQIMSGAWDATVRIWDCFDDLDQWIRPDLF